MVSVAHPENKDALDGQVLLNYLGPVSSFPPAAVVRGEFLPAGHGRTASPDDGRPHHHVRGGGAESQAGSQEECEEADIWVAWRRAGGRGSVDSACWEAAG